MQTRRQFISGSISDTDSLSLAKPSDSLLITASRSAMAGEFEIDLNANQYPQGMECSLDALDEVTRLDEKLSFFRPNSVTSYLNVVAKTEAVEVDDEVFGFVRECVVLWRETGGAFDITAAPLWETWGFARRDGRLPSDTEISNALDAVCCGAIELDESAKTIRFRDERLRLNFGAVGKGFAIDAAGRTLLAGGIDDFLIHGSFSSILANGTQHNTNNESGWQVGIAHPLKRGQRLREIRLHNVAVGTSGTQQQFFVHRGKRYGHIIDPRTGQPSDSLIGVTVIAPTAMLADALSTAFFVMGPDATIEYCENHENIKALITIPVKKGGGYEIVEVGEI
ncbi:MAG: FAD:protein FMN transferase [Planctomycetaceae bacterium]|jgi:thiamine biosynthesis lipoprotein|nr:FAD:protein FMN transferase [Planctomycetaceae bacterium]